MFACDKNNKEFVKKCCEQIFPKNHIAASILLVVSVYTTLLSIIDQASTKEAIKDANNQSVFNINEEIKNVTVSAISYSILWNCRDYSVTKRYYKGCYVALITILLFYIIFGMFKFPKYERKRFDGCSSQLIQPLFQFLSDLSFRISLIFLLTSYDIDPWICFCGPSSITYVKYTHEVHLEFPSSVLMYQRASPFISTTFGLAGWILGCFVQEIDPDQKARNPDPDQGSNYLFL